jgi:hypothetical protein
MKRFSTTIVCMLLLLTTAVADQRDEKPWFDMQNCEICKPMGEHMDVMKHVTWEAHKIDNGMLSASVVPDEDRAMVDAIHKKMHAVGELLATGKEMDLCGFCTSYAALKRAGAKEQEIKTDFGMISMLTSDDPEVVTKIHAHAHRTVKEFAAMKEMMATKQ